MRQGIVAIETWIWVKPLTPLYMLEYSRYEVSEWKEGLSKNLDRLAHGVRFIEAAVCVKWRSLIVYL